MSIAGGHHRAVQRAGQCGCDCVQLFIRSTKQWHAKEIGDDAARRFAAALNELGIRHPLAHDSYLINLASPEPGLWERSVDAFVDELRGADRLAIPYVVTHPGSHTTTSAEEGLRQIVRALNWVYCEHPEIRADCLLETTAGQGTSLGWRFEHFADILMKVKYPERLGICFDTCHVFAAGYPLGTRSQYRRTMKQFDTIVGLAQIKAFHLNDSRRECGSRVDRHAHIGRGEMGLEPFRLLLDDVRFQAVPMYLETPKGTEEGEDLDVVNLRTLRSLLEP